MLIVRFSIMEIDLTSLFWKNVIENTKWILHLKEILSLDLYQLLKPCQSLLKLTRMKQPDLEKIVGIHNRKYVDGGQCIRLYRNFIKRQSKSLRKLWEHNEEDLWGLENLSAALLSEAL